MLLCGKSEYFIWLQVKGNTGLSVGSLRSQAPVAVSLPAVATMHWASALSMSVDSRLGDRLLPCLACVVAK